MSETCETQISRDGEYIPLRTCQLTTLQRRLALADAAVIEGLNREEKLRVELAFIKEQHDEMFTRRENKIKELREQLVERERELAELRARTGCTEGEALLDVVTRIIIQRDKQFWKEYADETCRNLENSNAKFAAECAELYTMRHYRSTACYHEQHGNCRFQCKFCEQQCSCDCHTTIERETEKLPTYAELLKRIQELEEQLVESQNSGQQAADAYQSLGEATFDSSNKQAERIRDLEEALRSVKDDLESWRIDVLNLRFYAKEFREREWQTDIIHWSVFAHTLEAIADRIQKLLTPISEPVPPEGSAKEQSQ